MKVPFFDLQRIYQEQKGELEGAVARVLERGNYILGEACCAFETEFTRQLSPGGEGSAVACASGTDALILSLLATGVRVGDEVITVSHTAIPTVAAIRAVGATPVFVDVDARSWLLDLEKLPAAVGPKTKAVIAVHLYGNMVPVGDLRRSLGRLGREDVTVIEDAAQALGAVSEQGPAGTLGRFGAFSFYPTKNLGAMGDGGAVFCRNEADAEVLRMLRVYGQVRRGEVRLSRGINSRLDEVQAAILSVRLNRLEDWNRKRASLMERYRRGLAGLPLRFAQAAPGCRPAWHLCVVALEDARRRDAFIAHLVERGVETSIHYPIPNHLQPGNPTPPPRLEVTESLAGTIVSLPFHSALRDDELDHVVAACRSYFGENGAGRFR